jgi:hypothetical protein
MSENAQRTLFGALRLKLWILTSWQIKYIICIFLDMFTYFHSRLLSKCCLAFEIKALDTLKGENESKNTSQIEIFIENL